MAFEDNSTGYPDNPMSRGWGLRLFIWMMLSATCFCNLRLPPRFNIHQQHLNDQRQPKQKHHNTFLPVVRGGGTVGRNGSDGSNSEEKPESGQQDFYDNMHLPNGVPYPQQQQKNQNYSDENQITQQYQNDQYQTNANFNPSANSNANAPYHTPHQYDQHYSNLSQQQHRQLRHHQYQPRNQQHPPHQQIPPVHHRQTPPAHRPDLPSKGEDEWGENFDDQEEDDEEDEVNINRSANEAFSQASMAASRLQMNEALVAKGLSQLYRKKIRPLEVTSKYGHFSGSHPLQACDFDAVPMILLLGQYSVGKTSFIRYLLGRDFPGIRIGPEPTTDRFVAVMKGDRDKVTPGAALCSQMDRPFRALSSFGNHFLSRFEGVEMNGAPILNNVTLIDTPGILSGRKQSAGRKYDYEQVMKWFAERSDLIIVMFDAHKLDISDELKRVIELLAPYSDKVRVVLNKADSISTQQLMRVYGALMWSLGKVLMTPEVARVYMGSFWDRPLQNIEQAPLFRREADDLFRDIRRLPLDAITRRIDGMVKRARSVKVHAYIIHYLRKQLRYTAWGRREKQAKLISPERLPREFAACARRYGLPLGDFPALEPTRLALLEIKDLTTEFPKLDKRLVRDMDKVFQEEIPRLLEKARDN